MPVKRIPDHLVAHIVQFNLDEKLVAEGSLAFPMKIKEMCGENTYVTMIETGKKDIWEFKKHEIELKGNVDIEFLRYRGKVKLEPLIDQPGHYKMKIQSLYQLNQRKYKRVPYRRAIQITEPVEMEGFLNNISASGAMVYCNKKLDASSISMSFTLLKHPIQISARIVQQIYDEALGLYIIRCHFEPIDTKVKNIISQAVREITLMAKKRLNE